MAKLNQEQVFKKLHEKGARPVCEVCGHNAWAVAEADGKAGMVVLSVQSSTSSFQIGGNGIPAYLNICTNCGNVRLHAVGVIAPEAMKNG